MTREGGQRRILVVDDEPDIRTVVGLNLRLEGMEFGEAANGQEALEMLRHGHWDALLLDLMMPGMDGFEVLSRLGPDGLLDDLTVVVLSAQGTPTAAMTALDLGAHLHVTKPFSARAVARAMDELISMSPEEREERRFEGIRRAGTLERLGMPTV